MPGPAARRFAVHGIVLAISLPALLAASFSPPRFPQKAVDVPSMLRRIHQEVREIGKYPGEDFARGDFFLGEGDDDTNKTHHVGILIKDEAEGPRMTIRVTRLEPSRDDPRVRYGREPRTIVCRFAADGVEVVSSDYSSADLKSLLPEVVRAIVAKKNLLKK